MAVVEAIATTYVEADQASVTFSSLGSYEHLQLRCSIMGGRDGSTNNTLLVLNGDTSSTGYSNQSLFAGASSTYNTAQTGENAFGRFYNTTPSVSSEDQASFAMGIIDILDYRNTNKNTSVFMHFGANLGSYWYHYETSGVWDNTAAVTSVTVIMDPTYNTARGTMVSLYGLNSS